MPDDPDAATIDELLAHRAWVKALARALTGNVHMAADVEQETWLAAVERPPQERTHLRAWLARVVRRRASDQRRGEGRRRRREDRQAPRRNVPSPEELASRAETQVIVARAVLTLDEPYRSTVLLRFVEEMKPAEIAAHQGVPVETVRTRLKRAVATLRGRLERGFGAQGRDWRHALLPIAGIEVSWKAAALGGTLAVTTKTKSALVCVALLLALLGAGALLLDLPGRGADSGDGALDRALHRKSSIDAGARSRSESVLRGATDAERPGATGTARGGGRGERATGAMPASATPADASQPKGYTVREGDPVSDGVVAGVVRDDQGRPLPSALILLTVPPGAVTSGRIETDETGAFHFADQGDRPYLLVVSAAGWVVARVGVRPGERLLDVTLERGLTISGRAILEDAGVPVADLYIEAVEGAGGAGAQRVWTRSDEHGAFVLGGLTPGSWTVSAGGSRGIAEEFAREYVETHVGSVEAGTDDLQIELQRGYVIEGVIHGPDGEPWSHAITVRVALVDDKGDVDYRGQRFVDSDTDGQFRVTGLARGRYDIVVTPLSAPDGAPTCCTVHLGGIPAGTTGLVVNLIEGRVLAGRLVDETGEPVLAKGWVWVSPTGTGAGTPGSVVASLLDDGRFVTPPIDPGKAYDIRAGGFTGYGEGRRDGVTAGDAEVILEMPRGLRITGRVVDGAGKAVPAGVPVMAKAQDRPVGPHVREPWEYAYARTAADGTFVLSGLKATAYRVEAGGTTSGYLTTLVLKDVKAPAEDLVLHVERGVVLTGRLLDARGDGVSQVPLYARSRKAKSGVPVAVTRPDGTFAFAGVHAGKVTIVARVEGADVELGEFDAPAENVELKLPE